MITKEDITKVWEHLQEVTDPEIPVLTILDMGIVRDVKVNDQSQLEVVITPTYSGCPAMDMIAVNIKAVLQNHGFDGVEVSSVLSPAWTTDWLSEDGRKKLKAYGIAPPEGSNDKSTLFAEPKKIECPRCGSRQSKMIAEFGSTACKSLYQCEDCKEPFDYFKCH
ncbi:MAG: phenylacetate-CoA oxygenase subunit PaaJ [Aureispira sp.]|nr:phenylacetate-CoA oxygenase subunit PaaJ [Aureispira sp.]